MKKSPYSQQSLRTHSASRSPQHRRRHSWETKQEPPPAPGHSRQLGTELTEKPNRANCGSGFRQKRAQEQGKEDTHRAATWDAAMGPSILPGAPGWDQDRPGWAPAHITSSYWRPGLSSLFFANGDQANSIPSG